MTHTDASQGGPRASRASFTILSTSFFLASALGLVLLVVIARWLTPGENAHFQAIWGLIFAFASVLGSLEQEVTRRSTEAHLDGSKPPVGVVQAVGLAAMACLVILALLLATSAGKSIVLHSPVIVAMTALSLLNFVVLILARGVLLGSNALRAYAAVLAGEAAVRLIVLGALVGLGVDGSVEWAVFATVVGSLVWLPAIALLVRAIDWRSGLDPWRSAGGTVVALATANGLSALVLTGFPTVVALVIGEASQLAVLLAVITFARAPLALLAPVQALTVPTVVRWSRNGDGHRLTRALFLIAGGSVALALLGAVVGWFAGPWAVALVLGEDYRPSALLIALVAGATCVMAGALLQAAALVALQRYWLLASCWTISIAAAAAVMLAAPWSPEARGLGGFTAASVLAFVCTAVAVRRTAATASDAGEAGNVDTSAGH